MRARRSDMPLVSIEEGAAQDSTGLVMLLGSANLQGVDDLTNIPAFSFMIR